MLCFSSYIDDWCIRWLGTVDGKVTFFSSLCFVYFLACTCLAGLSLQLALEVSVSCRVSTFVLPTLVLVVFEDDCSLIALEAPVWVTQCLKVDMMFWVRMARFKTTMWKALHLLQRQHPRRMLWIHSPSVGGQNDAEHDWRTSQSAIVQVYRINRCQMNENDQDLSPCQPAFHSMHLLVLGKMSKEMHPLVCTVASS